MAGAAHELSETFLEKEYSFYELHREEYERDLFGRFVLIYGEELIGDFATIEEAIKAGIEHCGVEPVLIRKVGEKEVVLRSFSYNIGP